MSETQAKQLLILAAQADYLGQLRDRKRISDADYLGRLNAIRQQAGLVPISLRPVAPQILTDAAWGT